MISKTTIEVNRIIFKDFESELIRKTKKYHDLVSELDKAKKKNIILRKWFNLSNENYTIARRRISDFLCKGIKERALSDFQYGRQIGTVLMPIIMNTINSFEYISNLLALNSKGFHSELNKLLKPSLDSISNPKNWLETDESIRASVLNKVRFSINSISFQRKTLRQLGKITPDGFAFLSFVWNIRNSMHNNFINKEKISYRLFDEDTERELLYEIDKGKGIQFWDTPKWNIVITERLIEILVKIIVSFDDLPIERKDLVEI